MNIKQIHDSLHSLKGSDDRVYIIRPFAANHPTIFIKGSDEINVPDGWAGNAIGVRIDTWNPNICFLHFTK